MNKTYQEIWEEAMPELKKDLETNESFKAYCKKYGKPNVDNFLHHFRQTLAQSADTVWQNFSTVLQNHYLNSRNIESNAMNLADDLVSFLNKIYQITNRDEQGFGNYFIDIFYKIGLPQLKHNFLTNTSDTEQQTPPKDRQNDYPFAMEFKLIYDLRQFKHHQGERECITYQGGYTINPQDRRQIADYTYQCLMAYLGICLYNYQQLSRALDLQTEPDLQAYLADLQTQYDQFVEQYLLAGKKDNYIEQQVEVVTKQKIPTNNLNDLTDALNQLNTFCIIGEAGFGKTTAFKHLAAKMAKEATKAPDQKTIPIYVDLPQVEQNTLLQYIAKCLNATEQQITTMMQRNRLVLLLDALNEVADQHLDNRKKEINNLRTEYPKLKIIVCCRPNDKHNLTQIQTQANFKIDNKQKEDVLKRNLNPELWQEAQTIAKKDSNNFYKIFKTPFLLKIYVEVCNKNAKCYTNDIDVVEEYIEQLLHREITEKAHTDFANKLTFFKQALSAIAQKTKPNFSDLQAADILTEYCQQKAITMQTTDTQFVLQKATELKLLIQTPKQQRYQFATEEIKTYFDYL